jgi:hypothetical protein
LMAALGACFMTLLMPLSRAAVELYDSLVPMIWLLPARRLNRALPLFVSVFSNRDAEAEFFMTEAMPFLQLDLALYPSLARMISPFDAFRRN